MRRHVRDPYVKKSNQLGYRSRAALKLAQLDDVSIPGVFIQGNKRT